MNGGGRRGRAFDGLRLRMVIGGRHRRGRVFDELTLRMVKGKSLRSGRVFDKLRLRMVVGKSLRRGPWFGRGCRIGYDLLLLSLPILPRCLASTSERAAASGGLERMLVVIRTDSEHKRMRKHGSCTYLWGRFEGRVSAIITVYVIFVLL